MSANLMSIEALKWLLPIVFGALVLLIAVIGVIRGAGGWQTVVVAAFATALVGSGLFRTFSVTPNGIEIVTALTTTADIAVKLEKAVQDNALAIDLVNKRIDNVLQVSKTIGQPGTNNESLKNDLSKILNNSSDISAIILKQKDLIGSISDKNQALGTAIEGIKADKF